MPIRSIWIIFLFFFLRKNCRKNASALTEFSKFISTRLVSKQDGIFATASFPTILNFSNHFVDSFDQEFESTDFKTENSGTKSLLNGRKLIITTMNRPPFVILTTSKEKKSKIIKWEGFCINMINCLAEKLNFSYDLVLPQDMNWGVLSPNGTYNGMLGMIQRQEVDFAIASFTITFNREKDFDFTYRFYEDPTSILIQAPKERSKAFTLFLPYRLNTWLGIGIFVVVISFLFWTFNSCPNIDERFLYPYGRTYLYSRVYKSQFSTYFFETCFVLTGRSTNIMQTASTRVLLGAWWFCALNLMILYSGTLIILTIPQMRRVIQSIEEMANQNNILWTFRSNTVYDSLFSEASPGSSYGKIGELHLKYPDLRVNSDEEGVQVVINNNMAYIKEKSWLDFAVEDDFLQTRECRLTQVPETFFSARFGWALRSGTPYLQLFNHLFLRMEQTGLFSHWKKNYWPRPNKCTSGYYATKIPRPLHIGDMIGHFLILAMGFILSLFVFALEVSAAKLQILQL